MNLRTAALLLTICAPALFADTYQRQPAIDVQHYIFRVELTDANDEIMGEATVSVRFLKDAAAFWLDLASPATGKGMTVSEVTAGAPVAFTHRDDRLTLTLNPPAKAGEVRDRKSVV